MKTKFGFVAIIGRPNVGKSTILNRLMKEKIAITTPKPETTQSRILGVLTEKDYQIVFVDTPGINKGYNELSKKVGKIAKASLPDNDIIYLVVDKPYQKSSNDLILSLKDVGGYKFLIINKIDEFKNKTEIDQIILSYLDVFKFDAYLPVSAKKGTHFNHLLAETLKFLPEGPFMFDKDYKTNQTENERIKELIREQIMLKTKEEVPHAVAVVVEVVKFNEELEMLEIFADIIVEKPSQKQILIGKGGSLIKEIGKRARLAINELLKTKVHLNLWVKVKPKWRDKPQEIKRLGLGEK